MAHVFSNIKRNWGEQPSAFSGSSMMPLPSSSAVSMYSPSMSQSTLSSLESNIMLMPNEVTRWRGYVPPGASVFEPSPGVARIIVSRPPHGRLGLSLKELTVESVMDPSALQAGWSVGDRVMSVCNTPVSNRAEFHRALEAAMQANKATGMPLVFDVWRTPGLSSLGTAGVPGSPLAAYMDTPSPASYTSTSAYSPPSGSPAGRKQRRYLCGDEEPYQPSPPVASMGRRYQPVCGEEEEVYPSSSMYTSPAPMLGSSNRRRVGVC